MGIGAIECGQAGVAKCPGHALYIVWFELTIRLGSELAVRTNNNRSLCCGGVVHATSVNMCESQTTHK